MSAHVSSRPRVVAVIPALDEAPAVGGVVSSLRGQDLLDAVLVVDNGSSDDTGEVARRAGARVVREERRGYGNACRAGVLAAVDAEVIVLLDADAADDPGDLPRLLAPILEGRADLVVGTRGRGGREPGALTPQQVVGNRVAGLLLRVLGGPRVSDLGPFRAIRRDHLIALGMSEETYGWSVEMVVKAARAGLRYEEVPVRYRRRIGVSKVSGTVGGSVRAGIAIMAAIMRHARWRPPAQLAAPGRAS